MRKETIFSMSSPCRDDFRITAFRFGSGRRTVAVVGSMRGDEIQQQYVASQLVARLTEMEAAGSLAPDNEIMVIPSINSFSLNVGKRFWPLDNTDINRMFPGYDRGETTQRIAAAVFEAIKDFEYGIQLASFYMPGDFIPHVRMMQTGFEDIDDARTFGLPYVCIRKPTPYDTTLLNYNWQIWNTKAFSIYAGRRNAIDVNDTTLIIRSILRFMDKAGALTCPDNSARFLSEVIYERDLVHIKPIGSGLFRPFKCPGDEVQPGEPMGVITDALDGHLLETVHSPCAGTVFFVSNNPLVLESNMLFRINPQ